MLYPLTLGICLLASTVLPASAAFSSLYVFGDALSATDDTNNPAPGTISPTNYFGLRWSNGRVWVEVLAQRQGMYFNDSQNVSYFDHNSSNVVMDLQNFVPPADVTNDLFIVWVCNADTYDVANSAVVTSSMWTNAINQSQTNHWQIITNLYAMGVRSLLMPNAVDISKVPAFNQSPYTSVNTKGCIAYDAAFSNTISQARTAYPDLTIYAPDFFWLLNNVLTNAAHYGLTNALGGGYSIGALIASAYGFPVATTNGFGTNFVYWDDKNPTAKFHAVIADVAQQIISPVQVGSISSAAGTNLLNIVNYPAGLDGFVDGVTNLVQTNWTSVQNFSSTNTTQSVFVPITGPKWFYRLRFPYAWSWP
jgi:phospholipase/lecithinase/hemolysin